MNMCLSFFHFSKFQEKWCCVCGCAEKVGLSDKVGDQKSWRLGEDNSFSTIFHFAFLYFFPAGTIFVIFVWKSEKRKIQQNKKVYYNLTFSLRQAPVSRQYGYMDSIHWIQQHYT